MANFRMSGNLMFDNKTGQPAARVQGDIIFNNKTGQPAARMNDAKNAIQGATGSMTDVALWWFFVHKP